MKPRNRVIVLTPTRNEAWILERFLAVTSRIADHIVILDQHSTDGSREILRAHPECTVLKNDSIDYNEADRQQALIAAARRMFPGPRLLLALDADEVLAADVTGTDDWQRALYAEPGTVLRIEKPTFIHDTDHVIRYPNGWPLGFVDDGSEHRPRRIHSTRVPTAGRSRELCLEQVKALHYALLRPRAQAAKERMYSVIENLNRTRHLFGRRWMYSGRRDFAAEGPVEPTRREWLEGWEVLGIDMRTVRDEPPYWQDREVLRLFAMHGTLRFWLDAVWQVDWQAKRRECVGTEPNPSDGIRLTPPWPGLQLTMRFCDFLYDRVRQIRTKSKPALRRFTRRKNNI